MNEILSHASAAILLQTRSLTTLSVPGFGVLSVSACSVPLCIDPLSAISLPHPSFVSVRLSSVAFVLYHKFKGEYTAEVGDPSRNIQLTAALVPHLLVALLTFGWQASTRRKNQ